MKFTDIGMFLGRSQSTERETDRRRLFRTYPRHTRADYLGPASIKMYNKHGFILLARLHSSRRDHGQRHDVKAKASENTCDLRRTDRLPGYAAFFAA